jgi:hypothetical protein
MSKLRGITLSIHAKNSSKRPMNIEELAQLQKHNSLTLEHIKTAITKQSEMEFQNSGDEEGSE